MKVKVPQFPWYGDTELELDFPDSWEVITCQMPGQDAPKLSEQKIQAAFLNPIGTPQIAELARGKAGRVYGSLMALLTTMKALPLAYNRDMQEDKQDFFDTAGTLLSTLEVFTGMIRTLRVKAENTGKAIEQGYILATDLADYLVKKGEAFRTAHDIVARLVSYAVGKGKSFAQLSLSEFREFSPLFGEDVYSITVGSSLVARDVTGGTAPRQVEQALAAAKKIVDNWKLS